MLNLPDPTPEPQTEQPSWCDGCGRKHDVIVDHCANGKHCTSNDASCNAAWRVGDHSAKCCDCKRWEIPNA